MTRKIEQLMATVFGFYISEKDFQVSEMFHGNPISLVDAVLKEPKADYGKTPQRSKEDYVNWLKNKTKRAAIEIINLMEKTGNSPGVNVVRYQLIKSATSTAANYRAACRARSTNEFFAKMCIVVEEADETQFWLEVLEESEIKINNDVVHKHYQEWTEIVKIVTSAKAKAAARKKN